MNLRDRDWALSCAGFPMRPFGIWLSQRPSLDFQRETSYHRLVRRLVIGRQARLCVPANRGERVPHPATVRPTRRLHIPSAFLLQMLSQRTQGNNIINPDAPWLAWARRQAQLSAPRRRPSQRLASGALESFAGQLESAYKSNGWASTPSAKPPKERGGFSPSSLRCVLLPALVRAPSRKSLQPGRI